MERLHNKGLRLALGYRNSTPLNVITTEAKVLKIIKDRAGLLVRNYWTKIICQGHKDIEAKMNRMIVVSNRNRQRDLKGNFFLLRDLV